MRRQLILLWLLHFSATVLSLLTISAPSTTESVPSPSIPSLRPSHLMLPFSPSPLSSSQSKVSDIRPQHSQLCAAAAATTVPRLSPCFCFRMRVEYSNRRLRRRRDGRRCRWEYVRDQGEPSHVRYSLAASEVSILPPCLPYPTLSPATFSGSR